MENLNGGDIYSLYHIYIFNIRINVADVTVSVTKRGWFIVCLIRIMCYIDVAKTGGCDSIVTVVTTKIAVM